MADSPDNIINFDATHNTVIRIREQDITNQISWVGRLSKMDTVMLRGVGAGLVSSSCISGPEPPARNPSQNPYPAPSGPDPGRPGHLAGPARTARDLTGRPKGESQQELPPPVGLESHADVSGPGLL